MIQIKSIKLTDFGRHKKIDAQFEGHVVGLSGPNGRGKSTVLQALQLALTGTIDHPDALREFIRRSSGAKPPKAAQVEVEFVADGKEGRIIRRITPTTSTRKLYWDGAEKPITAEKKVASVLFDILGVDKKAINSTVFISQGEMNSMFKQETDRRDFYTKLLMLGHLAKVGNIAETHRAHIADTVQDLGAVRDAADATYREAAEYFETTDEALKAFTDVTEPLADMRALSGLFTNQAEAEEEMETARKKLDLAIPDVDEDKVESVIEDKKSKLNEQRAKLEELTNRQHAHLKAKGDQQAAAEIVRRNEDAIKKFDELAEAEKELENHISVGSDPTPLIRACEDKLAELERLDEMEKALPGLLEARNDAERKQAEHTENVKSVTKSYDEVRGKYKEWDTDLKVRLKIRQSVDAGHMDGDCGCPVCGAENPDASFLDRTIAEANAALKELEPTGVKLGEEKEAAEADLARFTNLATIARSNHENTDRDYKRAKVTLALVDKSAVEKDLVSHREALKIFTIHAEEDRRLKEVVRSKKAATAGLESVTNNDMAKSRLALEHADHDLNVNPWSDEDKETMTYLTRYTRELTEELEGLTGVIASHTNSRERLAQASKELQDRINTVTSIPGNILEDVKTALTAQHVLDVTSELEVKKQERDEAVGRKDAANEALKAASRRVDELSLRTAEQKHRLKLADDLAKLRDTFKPNGASLEYLNYKFGKIARLAADYLAESGADFMVAASEEIPLSYEFLRTDRSDEVWMPQSRMSGGQKVRLAVATLRAIHAMIMPEVGLLVLDEPTTHLDVEAQRSMADMLQKIGEEGTLQMIVCDHSTILIDAFSDTIEIPE